MPDSSAPERLYDLGASEGWVLPFRVSMNEEDVAGIKFDSQAESLFQAMRARYSAEIDGLR
ncbi:MAG: hypothetical protein ABSB15_03445 [Bryobacteraceae bacterium]